MGGWHSSRAVAALALVFASCSSALAQKAAPPPDRWAILVGDARGDARGALAAAMAEAAATLRQEYGYSRERIVEILGGDASRDNIRKRLQELNPRPGPNDSLFAFVLLPAVTGKSNPFFLPAGGNEDEIWTLVGIDEIEDAVAGFRSRTSLTVVNTCPSAAGGSRTLAKQSAVVQRGLASTLLFCDPRAPDHGARRFAEALPGLLRTLASAAKERVTDIELAGSLRDSLPGIQLDLRRTSQYSDEGFSFVVSRLRITNLLAQLDAAETPSAKLRAIDAIVPAARASDEPGSRDKVVAGLNALAANEDQDRAVRLRAVNAMGAVGLQLAVPDLTILSRQALPPEIRQTSVETLARIGTAETLSPIVSAMADESPFVRVAAVRGAGTHRNLQSAEPILARVNDTFPDVRAAALQMIAILAKPRPGGRNLITLIAAPARKATQQALLDPAASVRREAVNARARLGVDLARDQTVLKMLTSDVDNDVRITIALIIGREYRSELQVRPAGRGGRPAGGPGAAMAAGQFKEPEQRNTALNALFHAASQPFPTAVRAAAIWSLGEIGDPKASATLIKGLADPEEAIREAAAEGLGKMRDREAVMGIVKLLDEKSPRVRSTAARALGLIRDPVAGPILVDHLKTESNAYVRQSIEEAIKGLPTASTAALAAALGSEWPNVRRDAVERLAGSEDPAAAQFAIDRLADPDNDVRRAALSVISDRGVVWSGAVVSALQSTTTAIRFGAAAALGSAKNANAAAGKALSTALDREVNPVVRAQIVASLGQVQPTASEIEIVLLGAALDPDPMLREAAAGALASYSTPRSRDMLLTMAGSDEALEVRDTAIRSLRSLTK